MERQMQKGYVEHCKLMQGARFKIGDLVRVDVNPKPDINYTAAGKVLGRGGCADGGRIYWIRLEGEYPQAKERDWYPEEKVNLDTVAMDFEQMDQRRGSMALVVAVIGALAALTAVAAWAFLA